MATTETGNEGPDAALIKADNAAQRFARWPANNKEVRVYQRVGASEQVKDREGKLLLDNFGNECWGFPVEYEGSEGMKLFKLSLGNSLIRDVLKAAPTIQSRFKMTCLHGEKGKKTYIVESA